MILWMVKLVSSLRRAVAGRRYPSQLAWAVSFGLLLGLVPHGNLLAIAILIVVLSLRINHAMAGLTAIGVSFLATRLDPVSTQVGQWVLSHPQTQQPALAAWDLPLVPWTDLNNTVVMGSFLIGTAALLPVFLLTYPVFRLFAPRKKTDETKTTPQPTDSRVVDQGVHQVVLVDPSHQTIASPHHRPASTPAATAESAVSEATSQQHVTPPQSGPAPAAANRPDTASHTDSVSQTDSVSRELETPTDASLDADEASTVERPSETASKEPVPELEVDAATSDAPTRSVDPDFVEIDHRSSDSEDQVTVQTRIDVIRVQDHRDSMVKLDETDPSKPSESSEQPIDEALNYLLRQLRDSQQRKAA